LCSTQSEGAADAKAKARRRRRSADPEAMRVRDGKCRKMKDVARDRDGACGRERQRKKRDKSIQRNKRSEGRRKVN